MLPNKPVAVLLVALLALGAFAGLADAQSTLQSNLVISRIEYASAASPRLAWVEQTVNVTIMNTGGADFSSNQGWRLFVGLNGQDEANCIQPDDNELTPKSAEDCYVTFYPGNATTITRNGGTITVRVPWNATFATAELNNEIYAEILTLTGQPGDVENCSGPEPILGTSNEICRDNSYTERNVQVRRLGVRAEPLREARSQDDDRNEPYRSTDIRTSDVCEPTPANLTRGCYAVPGRSYVAKYKLYNVGNQTDTYTPEPRLSDGIRDRDFEFDFTPHNVTIPAQSSAEVSVTITIPENDTAGGQMNVDTPSERIQWRSLRAGWFATDAPVTWTPGCQETAFEDYCVNPTLPSIVTGARYAFNVTSNFSFDEMAQGETTTFLLNITNNGNAADLYEIRVDYNSTLAEGLPSIDGAWSSTVEGPTLGPTPVEEDLVTPGERFSHRLLLKAPDRIYNGTYWFDVDVKSRGANHTGVNPPCKANEVRMVGTCTLRFAVHVAQDYKLTAIAAGSQRAVPAKTVTYELGITNDGNGYDNLTLELGQSTGSWDVRLSNRTVALTPFNTTRFTLTVASPPNTLPDTEATFYVNATSNGPVNTPPSERSRVSIPSRLTITSGPNIRVDAPVNSSFVDAGASVGFDLTITNVGNVVDSFSVPLPDRPADWGVTVSPEGPFELQPNQQAAVRINLTAPQGATVGERATALVKVKSSVDRLLEEQVALEGRVSGPDYFVDNVLVNASSPYTGDLLEITVSLGNSGNRPADQNATMRVFFVQDGVEREIGTKTYPAFSIAGQRRLTETFTWDTTGVEGAGVLLARIDVNDEVAEIDDSAASNERTRAITLRTFDIKLTPATGLTARPGERVTYGEEPNVVIVEYRGNQPSEPVTIRFESEHGWLSSQSELTLALPRNTPLPVIATLDVPALPGAASDKLTVTVIPSLRPEEQLSATMTTTILDEEKPIIKAIVAEPASATLGTPVTITATVEDATGLTSVTAYVTTPTNETSSLTLFKVSGDTWAANKTFGIAGRYRVAAEAIDAATPANRNTTREFLGSFTMTPGSAPTIKLATGQAATVRTGSPIKLDIRDPLGIGKASYAIKGVTYELQGPGYQIDTSTFPAGQVEVNVTAENIYGVASTAKFTFSVDNTPPTVNRITISPERPRANEDVTITIQTETTVEAVDVLIKRDGQIVQSLNATKRGVGSFVLTFNPGEGDYSVDVTARDEAGNTKLAEEAVVFSARPGSPFDVPAPSVWMLLGGLAAVAFVMRRRA